MLMENYITSTNLSKEWNQDDPGNCGRIYIYYQLLWKYMEEY